jgi:hypothetical protein
MYLVRMHLAAAVVLSNAMWCCLAPPDFAMSLGNKTAFTVEDEGGRP